LSRFSARRALTLGAVLSAVASVGCPGPSTRTRPPATFDPLPDDEEQDLEGGGGFTEEERAQSRGKLGGIWLDCYSTFRIRDGARPDLERLAKACGPTTSLVPVTEVRGGGKQSARSSADRFTFAVKGGGRCYRIFATGERSVQDLDVAVVDEDGTLIASDRQTGPAPVVPGRGPLCLDRAGSYTLEVSVVRGDGAYALQVWGDP
jgi:hypothetical protein